MINLLPSGVKKDIIYARRNTSLRAWTFAILCCIFCIALVIAAGHFYLQNNVDTYSKQVTTSKQQLSDQKLEETQKEIETVSGNLKLVVQVLSRAILFSKFLDQIGATIPNGAVLTNLSISNKVQGGIDLQFSATDYQTATQVQLNLSDPNNQIFDKADLISVQCGQESASSDYPCSVQIRALFAKGNSFSFISTSNPGEAQ